MRPNTPHYVVTPKAAICHGGHFYATSTIRDTVYGVFHMFALSKSITNTEHYEASRILLRRLIVYAHHVLVRGQYKPTSSTSWIEPHVPNVTTLRGSLDLFLLCIVAELGELLDPIAYRKQYRDKRELEHDRLYTIHSRGLGRKLLEWWGDRFQFRKDDKSLDDGRTIFQKLFTHQVKVLTAYKKIAELKHMETEELACTGAAFELMAKKYFPILNHESIPDGASLQNFDWVGSGYAIRWKGRTKTINPGQSECVTSSHPLIY
jgi:hypothetical protein